MLLGLSNETIGAASVAVRSACAHSDAASGELLLSAERADAICASSRGSQNSARFELFGEYGAKLWHEKLIWRI